MSSLGSIFSLQPFEPKPSAHPALEGGEIKLYVLDGKAYPAAIGSSYRRLSTAFTSTAGFPTLKSVFFATSALLALHYGCLGEINTGYFKSILGEKDRVSSCSASKIKGFPGCNTILKIGNKIHEVRRRDCRSPATFTRLITKFYPRPLILIVGLLVVIGIHFFIISK